MFEGLDDSVFIGTPSTYGPADQAPGLLRDLADEDPGVVAEALYWIEASYFHQGQYCPATALTVPYLLELLQTDRAINRKLVVLVGEMLRGHRGVLPTVLEDLEDDEADTVRVIAAGQDVLTALLQHPGVEMRCAAVWALTGLPSPPLGLFEGHLVGETDPRVRVVVRVALDRLGAKAAAAHPGAEHPLERDALLILEDGPLDEALGAAYLRFLQARPASWFGFYHGKPWKWALGHLVRRDGPEVTALLVDAARLKPAADAALWPDDASDEPPDDEDDAGGDLARLLAERAFPDGMSRRPTDLTDTQRWLLRNLWIAKARGIGIYHSATRETQRAFADGDSPLDELLDFDGATRTVAEHLLDAPCTRDPKVPDTLEAVLAAHRAVRGDARHFELVVALARGDLAYGDAVTMRLVDACIDVVTLERTVEYLARSEKAPSRECEARLLLAPYLRSGETPPAALRVVVERQLTWHCCRADILNWFRGFPPVEKVAFAARVSEPRYWAQCDYTELGRAILALEPLGRGLPVVPRALLEAALADGGSDARQKAIAEELRYRDETKELSLETRTIFMTELSLRAPNGSYLSTLALDALHSAADLVPIFAVLRDRPHTRLKLYPPLPQWLIDALRAELGDRVHVHSKI